MHSIWRRFTAASLLALPIAASAGSALAQDYPTRPVRFISDSAPGSAIDVTMRVIVDGIGRVWGGKVPEGRYFANCVGIGFDAAPGKRNLPGR